jgi:UDP-N-acetylmuramate dehydrogenase
VLAGGSNVVVPDRGVQGLVIRIAGTGLHPGQRHGGRVEVTAAAGQAWDDLVAWAVAEGLAGIECLSGIPGTVGATPVQNVGAYGQEVADTIVGVRVFDRQLGCERLLTNAQCELAYRSSVLRRSPDRWIVLAVTFALERKDRVTVAYDQLVAALGESTSDLATVREAVLEVRRAKSMVLEPDDPNRRSAGSFFTNPVMTPAEAAVVAERARAAGAIRATGELRQWPAPGGHVKLSAAWLIECAGFCRGEHRGPVGLSTRHVLALVHHGGGRTADLIAFACEIQQRVRELLGVTLRPEPVLLGAIASPPQPWAAQGRSSGR